jgi:spore cortex biosynthesis protein YabQ
MDFTIAQLMPAFLFSLPLGFSLGIIYEPFRFFHKFTSSRNTYYLITDIIFMMICGIVTFFYCLAFLEGSIRWFVLIGEILGFFVYYRFVTPFFNKIYAPIIKFSKKIFGKLLKKGRNIMYNIRKIFKSLSCKLSSGITELVDKVSAYGKNSKRKLSRSKGRVKNKRSKTEKEKA